MRNSTDLAPRGQFRRRTATLCQGAVAVIGTAMILGIAAVLVSAALRPGGGAQAAVTGGPQLEVPAGLFFDAKRDDGVFEAPLVASDVAIEINGQVARVRVRQRFVNPSKVWLEGIYVFPLPERSAVDRLVMVIGDRRVEGKILEKEVAQKIYDKAAAQGKRASLLTSARPNVFMTKVANVGPGQEILVEIQYQDQAVYDQGRFSYRFPMVVAPRYTPGDQSAPLVKAPDDPAPAAPDAQPIAHKPADPLPVPGAGDLFGPVRHPDDGLANPVKLTVTLDAGQPLAHLDSLYHEVTRTGGDGRPWRIALADGPVPADRDFVLEWQPRASIAAEAAVFGEELDGDAYLLVSLLPPDPETAEAERQPRDLVLVVDTSGSMDGPSIAQARDALRFALGRLQPDDRFNIVQFDNVTYSLFAEVVPATEAYLHIARIYVDALEAGGGTEMRPALAKALREAPTKGRLRQVVFLTDGAVGNEHQLFTTIAGQLGETRLFTIGIGSAPNSYFMRKAAELGRGAHIHIGDVEEVAERMTGLFTKLERPALTDIHTVWPSSDGPKAERYPGTLPDLYSDQPVNFTVRLPGRALDQLSGELRLEGRRGSETWRRRMSLEAVQPAAGVAALWGRARFAEVQDGLYRGRKPAEVREEALAVALKHRLVTAYTSLVAVDDEVVRPDDAILESEEIARNLPHGWSYEHVFGSETKPMPLRQLPPDLLRKAGFGGQAVSLPQTATPAALQALMGSLLVLSAVFILIMTGRTRVRRVLAKYLP